MPPDGGDNQAPSLVSESPDARVLRDAGKQLGLVLSDEQIQRLLHYRDLLLKWNKTYNLTAIRQPEQALKQHLVDCLGVVGPIQRHLQTVEPTAALIESLEKPRFRLLDVGSGGGLPGVVIALLLPEVDVDCVDAVGKKAAFIRQVALDLRLPNLTAIHSRVQDMRRAGVHGGAGYDLIVSRAFSSLADLTQWTEHLIAPTGVWLAMKGHWPTGESTDSGLQPLVFHVEQLLIPGLDAQRCLVWLKRLADSAKATPNV
jgi:16S rRNA (guanine527-N7)-methyltransferase